LMVVAFAIADLDCSQATPNLPTPDVKNGPRWPRTSEDLAQKAAARHSIERHRKVLAKTGRDAPMEFFEHHARDGRQVEPRYFFERHPYEFNQHGIGASHALEPMRDPALINGEEAGIKPARPAWGRDRPADELQCAQVGQHV